MKYRNEAERIAEAKRVQAELANLPAGIPADLTADALAAVITATEDRILEKQQLDTQLAAATEAKRQQLAVLRTFMKRVHSAAKAIFGDDSLEYEAVGGTRLSEKKRVPRRGEASAA